MRRNKTRLYGDILHGVQSGLTRTFALRMLNAHPLGLDPAVSVQGEYIDFHWYTPYRMRVWCFAETHTSIRVGTFTDHGEIESKGFLSVDGAVDYVSPSLRLDTTLRPL